MLLHDHVNIGTFLTSELEKEIQSTNQTLKVRLCQELQLHFNMATSIVQRSNKSESVLCILGNICENLFVFDVHWGH